MTLAEIQTLIDEWIRTYGVRYFDEKTNTILLMEEVGEFSRIIARLYGEQSFKKDEDQSQILEKLADEWADIFFVMVCLANQTGIDIISAVEKNLQKKTKRDHERHKSNEKLK